MKYQGKLYGRVGRRHFELKLTADDVDRLEQERDEARRLAEEGREGQIPSNRIFPWEENAESNSEQPAVRGQSK